MSHSWLLWRMTRHSTVSNVGCTLHSEHPRSYLIRIVQLWQPPCLKLRICPRQNQSEVGTWLASIYSGQLLLLSYRGCMKIMFRVVFSACTYMSSGSSWSAFPLMLSDPKLWCFHCCSSLLWNRHPPWCHWYRCLHCYSRSLWLSSSSQYGLSSHRGSQQIFLNYGLLSFVAWMPSWFPKWSRVGGSISTVFGRQACWWWWHLRKMVEFWKWVEMSSIWSFDASNSDFTYL